MEPPYRGESNIHKITHLIHQEPLISIGCGPNPMVVLDWIVERESKRDRDTTYANELRISPSLSIVVSTRWSHVTLTSRDYRSSRRNWRRKEQWESNETTQNYPAFFAPNGTKRWRVAPLQPLRPNNHNKAEKKLQKLRKETSYFFANFDITDIVDHLYRY